MKEDGSDNGNKITITSSSKTTIASSHVADYYPFGLRMRGNLNSYRFGYHSLSRSCIGSGELENMQRFGGGSNITRSSNYALIAIDPRGNISTSEPSSIILMHELIGHNHFMMHPKYGRLAHDVNYHYQKKLTGYVYHKYENEHHGYVGTYKVHWKKGWYFKDIIK